MQPQSTIEKAFKWRETYLVQIKTPNTKHTILLLLIMDLSEFKYILVSAVNRKKNAICYVVDKIFIDGKLEDFLEGRERKVYIPTSKEIDIVDIQSFKCNRRNATVTPGGVFIMKLIEGFDDWQAACYQRDFLNEKSCTEMTKASSKRRKIDTGHSNDTQNLSQASEKLESKSFDSINGEKQDTTYVPCTTKNGVQNIESVVEVKSHNEEQQTDTSDCYTEGKDEPLHVSLQNTGNSQAFELLTAPYLGDRLAVQQILQHSERIIDKVTALETSNTILIQGQSNALFQKNVESRRAEDAMELLIAISNDLKTVKAEVSDISNECRQIRTKLENHLESCNKQNQMHLCTLTDNLSNTFTVMQNGDLHSINQLADDQDIIMNGVQIIPHQANEHEIKILSPQKNETSAVVQVKEEPEDPEAETKSPFLSHLAGKMAEEKFQLNPKIPELSVSVYMRIFTNCASNSMAADNDFARQLFLTAYTRDEIRISTITGKTRVLNKDNNTKTCKIMATEKLCPIKYSAILDLWLQRFSIIEQDGKKVILERKQTEKFKSVIQNTANFIKKQEQTKIKKEACENTVRSSNTEQSSVERQNTEPQVTSLGLQSKAELKEE